MSSSTIGLYLGHWGEEFSIPARRLRNPLYMLRWALWFKANPRPGGYMRQLFAERHPDGEFVDVGAVDAATLAARIGEAAEIVLLYPDSIGIGFGGLEKRVRQGRNPIAGIRVLNGRRREFVLSCTVRRNLRTRRILELTMLPELAAGAAMLLATPFLLTIDLLKGKK